MRGGKSGQNCHWCTGAWQCEILSRYKWLERELEQLKMITKPLAPAVSRVTHGFVKLEEE